MYDFLATCFDIKNIQKPKKIDEWKFCADNKADAMDKAHSYFEQKFKKQKRLIEVKEI
ncbi:MAG: hypothetical protein AB7D43_13150 [Sulfurimonadaceae bacterium]